MDMVDNKNSIHERQTILKLLLIWEGRLNRGRLMDLLGIGANWASVWIREFRENHPDCLIWDTKGKSFYATAEAYKIWSNTIEQDKNDANSLTQYLALVGLPYAVVDGNFAHRGILAAFPDLSAPSPQVFAVLSEAIRIGRVVQLTYRSMQNPEPHQRIISPHNLIRAGRRWHVRAYCDLKCDFRDFALGRIVDVKLLPSIAIFREDRDEAWSSTVSVRLIAHPNLPPEQEKLIRFEYFGNTSARVVTCRQSLISYFIQDVRAAIDLKKQCPPDYQLAVENIEEIKPWLFPN